MFTENEKIKIEEKLRNYKCPICGSTNKLLNESKTHVIAFPETINGYDFTKVSHIDCLCVECLECGHIDQFHINTLLS